MQLVVATYERFLLGYGLPDELQVTSCMLRRPAAPVSAAALASSNPSIADACHCCLGFAGRLHAETFFHIRSTSGMPFESAWNVKLQQRTR